MPAVPWWWHGWQGKLRKPACSCHRRALWPCCIASPAELPRWGHTDAHAHCVFLHRLLMHERSARAQRSQRTQNISQLHHLILGLSSACCIASPML